VDAAARPARRARRGARPRHHEKSIRSLLHIIDDLLDVSRPSGASSVFEVGRSVSSRSSRAPSSRPPAGRARDIRCAPPSIPTPGWCRATEPAAAGGLDLLTNAIKFTPAGGRVHVRLERADAAALLTVMRQRPRHLAEFLPQRSSASGRPTRVRPRAQGGLGLGLDNVRHLIELHGGTVKVESPGEMGGATFTVTLPLHEPGRTRPPGGRAGRAGEAELAVAASSALDGARVLIVDDEADTREVLSVLLSGAGAEVRTSASAADALVILTRWQPDVLLADIAMPGEDGYALLSKLRALTPRQGGEIPRCPHGLRPLAGPGARASGRLPRLRRQALRAPALVAAIAKLVRTRRPSRRAAPPVRGHHQLGRRRPGHAGVSCAVLKDCGYRVLAAQGGKMRYGSGEASRRDRLVVTDLMMPRTSGVDVYRTLRSSVPRAVIVVSGYPLVAEMLGARQEGVVECLRSRSHRSSSRPRCAARSRARPARAERPRRRTPVRPRIPGLVLVTDRTRRGPRPGRVSPSRSTRACLRCSCATRTSGRAALRAGPSASARRARKPGRALRQRPPRRGARVGADGRPPGRRLDVARTWRAACSGSDALIGVSTHAPGRRRPTPTSPSSGRVPHPSKAAAGRAPSRRRCARRRSRARDRRRDGRARAGGGAAGARARPSSAPILAHPIPPPRRARCSPRSPDPLSRRALAAIAGPSP